MKPKMFLVKRSLAGFTCIMLFLFAVELQAALPPMSQEELEKESKYIVSGDVISVTSRLTNSKVERAFGIHRDRIYTIKLKVSAIMKGAGVKPGQVITVEAWQPAVRIPPIPGLQGNVPIPDKGDKVTVYVSEKSKDKFKPFMPNGITIKTKAKGQESSDADVKVQTQYVKGAALSDAQEQIVLNLAKQRGLKKIKKIDTYNLYPTAARGIRVKGADEIDGRHVSNKVLDVRYKNWWHPNESPGKNDLQTGDFWAGKPRTEKAVILKVGNQEYRIRSLQALSIGEAESILSLLLAGEYTTGPTVNKPSLKQVDWTHPLGFSKHGDAISVSFSHRGEDSGFFDLQLKLVDGQLSISQVLQAIP
ncbi:MAG: hypothetical protein P8N76_22775 [Pirellulaceae bacterium]|nr:hypothetical protein [Pirellulaceae bacterium]